MSPSTSSPTTLNFKGGFSLAAKAKTTSTKLNISSSLGKRPRTALHDDSDTDDERPAKYEAIVSVEDGKTLTTTELQAKEHTAGPLVIEFKKTRDFRDEIRDATNAKKGRNLLPPEVIAARDARAENEIIHGDGHEPVKWGLNIPIKERRSNLEPQTNGDIVKRATSSSVVSNDHVEQTADERAVDALMGVSSRVGPQLVIESSTKNILQNNTSEEDTYRRALRLAPEPSTLEDYERIPVEDYGAALLRGMGWNGKEKVKGPKEVERRANRLGLGAKALQNPEELGAWVMGGKKTREDRRPTPSEHKEKQDRKREERSRTRGSHRGDDANRRERDERSDRHRDQRRDDPRRDDRHKQGGRDRDYDRDRRRH